MNAGRSPSRTAAGTRGEPASFRRPWNRATRHGPPARAALLVGGTLLIFRLLLSSVVVVVASVVVVVVGFRATRSPSLTVDLVRFAARAHRKASAPAQPGWRRGRCCARPTCPSTAHLRFETPHLRRISLSTLLLAFALALAIGVVLHWNRPLTSAGRHCGHRLTLI